MENGPPVLGKLVIKNIINESFGIKCFLIILNGFFPMLI